MKSGFVAIIGRPNAGKSTLLNAIMKRKVSIISSKPQTTRNAIEGIYTSDKSQIIFIDTPGIHKANNSLGENMNKEAFSSTRDAEALILIVDASVPFGDGDQFVIDRFLKKIPTFIVFNKIDLCNALQIETLKKEYNKRIPNATIIEVSALKSANIDLLIEKLEEVLPEGPKYFPDDMISNQPETFLVAEIIREKILDLLKEEVPHSIAVIVEKMEEKSNVTNIHATIVCEKEGQKGIIIGKGGKMIKRIGMQARYDIENLLGIHCRLETFVRVEQNWRNSPRYLKEFGYSRGQD